MLYFVIAVIALVAVGLIGYGIGLKEHSCNHQFEKIIHTISGQKEIVVYMCMKCGKRKITKV